MNYQEYLKSDHWKQKRVEALEFYNYSCVFCNGEQNLEVHHLHYKTLWIEDCAKDLIVLCDGCHEVAHWYNDNEIIFNELKTEFSLTEYLFIGLTNG